MPLRTFTNPTKTIATRENTNRWSRMANTRSRSNMSWSCLLASSSPGLFQGRSFLPCGIPSVALYCPGGPLTARVRLLSQSRGISHKLGGKADGASMVVSIQREFYRSARRLAPANEDTWQLVFDSASGKLLDRHE